MLKLHIIDSDNDHILVSSDEPARIEISQLGDNSLILHAYRGLEVDTEQEPDLTYDGSIAEEMQDMVSQIKSEEQICITREQLLNALLDNDTGYYALTENRKNAIEDSFELFEDLKLARNEI